VKRDLILEMALRHLIKDWLEDRKSSPSITRITFLAIFLIRLFASVSELLRFW
jgi:hypothetical protein